MEKPRIGITSDHVKRLEKYRKSVEEAGGEVTVLLPGSYSEGALADLDGLLLTGGGDIDASEFGDENNPQVYGINRKRDKMELDLVREAKKRGTPVFGICRGLQVMNVAMGGTLIQHIPDEIQSQLEHFGVDDRQELMHDVSIQENTKLHDIIGKSRIGVNSIHHQSIKKLGNGLVKTAWADDGVIEGIENPDARFFLAVQWHPEEFVDRGGTFRVLFESFVAAASKAIKE